VTPTPHEDLLRELSPQVLGALVRRYGHFDHAEDAVQEALLAAYQQWRSDGIPDNPKAWLITVSSRRLTDLLRSEQSRARREDTVATRVLPEDFHAPPADAGRPGDRDDSLILLFMCCHPELSAPSQIALALRAVGGLTTVEIARAFLVPEATMAQRISRAKKRIKDSGVPFTLPGAAEMGTRLDAVLRVVYLIFTEGYAATEGPRLYRADLSGEAIRLTRMLHRSLPEDGPVIGLLALMLLTEARRPARTDADGELVPLAEQDRSTWLSDHLGEGVAMAKAGIEREPIGGYQLQAAIAAVHAQASSEDTTDWGQIVGYYDLLLTIADSPVTRLNRAVAVAMGDGASHGLELVDELAGDERMQRNHRYHAARAHLLERVGDRDASRAAFELAARLAGSLPEKRYLNRRAQLNDHVK
jgi:RNA polymerase sigma factor (sigma-70 family)